MDSSPAIFDVLFSGFRLRVEAPSYLELRNEIEVAAAYSSVYELCYFLCSDSRRRVPFLYRAIPYDGATPCSSPLYETSG